MHQYGAHVVIFGFEDARPISAISFLERTLGKVEKNGCSPLNNSGLFTRFPQTPSCILPDHLQHVVAGRSAAGVNVDERPADQSGEGVYYLRLRKLDVRTH